MKRRKELFVMLGMLTALNIFAESLTPEFNQIYKIIEQENYFKAEDVYDSDKDDLSEIEQKFTEAILDNAFNRIEESDGKIDYILKSKKVLPDYLELKLYEIKGDNALKSYQYEKAGNAYSTILNDYSALLSERDIDDYHNVIKLWSALKNAPPQTVDIRADTTIKMQKDMSGSDTLKVFINNISENFLFDTGANLSTVSESAAERLSMKMIPADITVGSITGMKIQTQLAICEKLTLGNIDVYNAVFLVVPDEFMIFPEDNYRIHGLIGYPIIKAFKEVQLNQSGEFIVKKQSSSLCGSSNLAMDGLMPFIEIEGKHYSFDTGGETTMLYHKYYIENKESIEKKYKLEKVSIGGIGGFLEFDGFIVDMAFTISGKDIELKGIELLKDKIHNETTYGNIGQDVIRQFDSMILNFDQMFIKFE